MRKVFDLGKIDWNGTGRRVNQVTIEIELREDMKGRPVFSACGNVYNGRGTDIITGGQILDEILDKMPNNALVQLIVGLWNRNHLNDMHTGTEAQEAALEKLEHRSFADDCEYLKQLGLYEDNGYKFGSSWLYREISKKDLVEIKKLLEN